MVFIHWRPGKNERSACATVCALRILSMTSTGWRASRTFNREDILVGAVDWFKMRNGWANVAIMKWHCRDSSTHGDRLSMFRRLPFIKYSSDGFLFLYLFLTFFSFSTDTALLLFSFSLSLSYDPIWSDPLQHKPPWQRQRQQQLWKQVYIRPKGVKL